MAHFRKGKGESSIVLDLCGPEALMTVPSEIR